MSIKEDLVQGLESARQNFHHLLDSVPEAFYHHPSLNPAWMIGDVLYHITLGPPAIRFEIWMIFNAKGLFQFFMNDITAKLFNWGNALFTRHPKRITRQGLLKAYEAGHAGLLSSLKRMEEKDLQKAVIYPESFVPEIAGEVSIEQLFRYAKSHVDIHAEQIRKAIEENK
jgi:hypothetical protein